MKVARLHRYREPFRLEAAGEPRLGGPHDIVVRVAACGLCRTDLHIIAGMLEPFGVRLPYTPGHEAAGWVEEAGPEVRAVRPGDPVLVNPNDSCGRCRACRLGLDTYCASATETPSGRRTTPRSLVRRYWANPPSEVKPGMRADAQ